jgi:hypothetical protein
LGEVYVEAKQVSSKTSQKAYILHGFHEALDGVRQFKSMKSVVLAIFVLDGPRYELPEVIEGDGGGLPTYPIVIDLRPSSERGAQKPMKSVVIATADFLSPRPKKKRAKK